MSIKYFILYIILLNGISFYSTAQEPLQDSSASNQLDLTPEEFQNFQLPSLQILYENAKNNPQIASIAASIAAAEQDTKLARRDWWNFFSLHAGYNYGILGTYVDSESEYKPLTTTYSGASQSSWMVGANINITLDKVFNRRLNVKRQQHLVESQEYNRDIMYNEIKQAIIELYTNIQYELKMVKVSIDAITLYEANYNVAKNDFINNKITTATLTEHKNSQRRAQNEYELIASQLTIHLLKLEIISNTKLISK